QRRRVELCRKYDALFTQVDAILSPSFAGAWLTATNFTGHPSLTLPVALVERSLFPDIGATEPPAPSEPFLAPLGMTLWGQLYQDGRLAEIGALLETRLKMQEKRPPL